jgi:hypothetical protein
VNMGHNDLNSPGTGKDSETFANDIQNKLFINALLLFGGGKSTAIAVSPRKPGASAVPGLRMEGSHIVVANPAGVDAGAPNFDLGGRELSAGPTAK